ncbi:MAG: 4-hydroxy-3-methylbut-2-enyl diphosphate reductase [Candidatus Omnitrophica bacterium]|nr:4-hydroxy-3-methylbut-2-enyl diphosphate reductase [Candidatus Omnitrophota bacterium]MDD5356089.1 4-hydroxy-3-methylbut-2-enyl diphosphate reductase [Candidatus Omnitrophota bacterium]
MKIRIAKSAGFCFGVKRAIKIANETLKEKKKAYMLGDIVHNEDVTNQLDKAGIKRIKRLGNGKGKTLLIRAHGSSRKLFNKALQLGYSIVDATCPMVKEIQNIAIKNELKGYHIIIIGDKKHDEVHSIMGQLKNKAVVIDNIKNIPWEKIKKMKKAAVVVQSTQNMEKVKEIVNVLNACVGELKFFNTICKPTRTKQEEIKTMPLVNDVMIIIGSKTSANTKRLYEISKSLNKNSYWVNSGNGIMRKWFENKKSVGITAGASTPESTTREIIKYIKKF